MTQPIPLTVPASLFAAASLETVADAMRIGTLPVMHNATLHRHEMTATDLLTLADRFDRPIEWQGPPGTGHHIPKVEVPIGAALSDEITILFVAFGLHAEVDDPRFNEHNDNCLTSQHGSSDPDYPSDPKPAGPYPVPR